MAPAEVVKRAVWAQITADATLMAKLTAAPWPGRLPDTAPATRTRAAITMDSDTTVAKGTRFVVTLALHVWSLSHDLAADVCADLRRLFDPSAPRRMWRLLPTAGGERVAVRVEFEEDAPDPESEVFHRILRLRALVAPKAP
jgi:hypothetical protein